MLTKILKTQIKRRQVAFKYLNAGIYWLTMVLFLAFLACDGGPQGVHGNLPAYPSTPYDSSALDDYYGTMVPDPYRWLENDTSAAWRRWVADQRSITDAFLGKLAYRPLLDTRLQQLWSYERYSVPTARDSFFFIFRNEGLQPHDVLYRTSNPNGGKMTVVLDPATLGPEFELVDGTISPSADGNWLAFQVAGTVPGWRRILVKDLRKDAILPDTLRGIRVSDISWWGEGFFYSRFPDPEPGQSLARKVVFQQLYYHRLGSPQEADELVFADRTNPELFFTSRTTADERFLLLQFQDPGGGANLYLRDLEEDDQGFEPVVESFDHRLSVVGSRGRYLLVLTNYKAPRQRLMRIDTRRPAPRYWKEVIPEDNDLFMRKVYQAAGHLFVVYVRNASHQLKMYNMEGQLEKELDLPVQGRVTAVEGGITDRRVYVGWASLVRPTTVYEFNLTDQTMLSHRTPTFSFDADAYQVKQVWIERDEGEDLPMFLLHRRALELDGRAPALVVVRADGGEVPGFNISGLQLLPVFLENGGIIAVPMIRGTGDDHLSRETSDRKLQLQEAVKTFLTATDYLIANRYSSADRLSVYGMDAGATIVAAGMMERPGLFGAVLLTGGAYDLLRYQHFSTDWQQAATYGSSDNAKAFAWLYPLSPLHRLKPGHYPPILIDSGRESNAMSMVHACKLGAALQNQQEGLHPVLLRLPPPGRSAQNPTTAERIAAGADMLAFIFSQLRYDPIYEQLE